MKLPKIPQYKVLPYDNSCFDKVKELFSMAFSGREIDEKSWEWQFYNNPCKNKAVTTLWDGDNLIALNGLSPAFCHLNGRKCISACSGTTMARPDYPGVSIQLFRECEEGNSDVELIYGFPNKNSFPIAKFIGHHYVGDICFWTIKPRRFDVSSNIYTITTFDKEEHGLLFMDLTERTDYLRDRNINYLNWRFVKKPFNNYSIVDYRKNGQIQGYLVYNLYREDIEQHLQVIDIIATTDESFVKLMEYAINEGCKKGVDIVKLWMSYSKYHETLRNLGFDYGTHPFKCVFWDRDMDLSDCYFTMSDSDIF